MKIYEPANCANTLYASIKITILMSRITHMIDNQHFSSIYMKKVQIINHDMFIVNPTKRPSWPTELK